MTVIKIPVAMWRVACRTPRPSKLKFTEPCAMPGMVSSCISVCAASRPRQKKAVKKVAKKPVKKPVKKIVKKAAKRPVKKAVKKPVKRGNSFIARDSRKGQVVDPALDPAQLRKAGKLGGEVLSGFGGQGIPLAGVAGVGVWVLLILRFTIFYGFFGDAQ